MSSRSLKLLLVALLCSGTAALAASPLRICADPDNPPFSTRTASGLDNKIAQLVAHDLHRSPKFVWTRSRRGFLREQFNKNVCDVLVGVPGGMKGVASTRPFYRSTYVFVTPAREHLQIASFSDPHLNNRRIGLQVLEEDLAPPSVPLIRNGHAAQLVGFDSFGAQEGDIVRAVADGKVGAAVVWGPVAGYFAAKQRTPLTLTPVSPVVDSGIPFVFSLGFAVHAKDIALRDALNASIIKLQPQINQVLAAYHVPKLPLTGGAL